ncbi:hypothetical protein NPS53_09390 [Pseudomonas putida]|uniref:hypothetical protein n=1 Tax=Pseudomonas putida TaxID=303 RepID=UPI0023640508|nr:hypothetical protein [Pseudomonas putida]MDD2139790.1 hypothetical protein [Pseudomonas putida]HDS1721714.1 hypothetical protein [Pseudomonas putida]
MTWLRHTAIQIEQAGVQCNFFSIGHPFQGWIMPDGTGVIHQDGITLEIQPETIVTDHVEGLRRARQGAANRHFEQKVRSYTLLDYGEWVPDANRWVKSTRAELAGVTGQLTITATFKAGASELLRFYTEFQSERHAQEHGRNTVRQGRVGDSLAEGDVVLTSSGRRTSPFPRIDTDTERKASNTLKRVDQWLIQNALDEASARGDEFNERQFKHSLSNPQQADKDCAEEYLFGRQPNVAPSLLRPLASTSHRD